MLVPNSPLSDRVVRFAHREAQKMGHRSAVVSHLLLALSLGGNSLEARALQDAGWSDRIIREKVRSEEGHGFRSTTPVRTSPTLERVINAASTWATSDESSTVKPQHLLTAALMSDVGRAFVGGPEKVKVIRDSLRLHQQALRSTVHRLR